MAFRVEKPAFNLRSKLTELDFQTLPYHKVNPGGIIQQKYYYSDESGGNESETSSENWQDSAYFTFYFTPREVDSVILINWLGRSRIRKFGSTSHWLRTSRYNTDDQEDQNIALGDGDAVWNFGANNDESNPSWTYLGYWYSYFNFTDFDDDHTTRQYKYVLQQRRSGGAGTVRIGENAAHGHLHAIITEVKQ